MHASFRIGSTEMMASDGRCSGKPNFSGVTLSLPVPDAATADRVFNALADGGHIIMPLGPTFYSPKFGMVTDRFGVDWMVIIPQPQLISPRPVRRPPPSGSTFEPDGRLTRRFVLRRCRVSTFLRHGVFQ